MTIKWTKRAERKFAKISAYLIEQWGSKVSEAFKERAFSVIELLAQFPEIGLVEVVDKGIRSFPVTRQTRVFYRLRNKDLIVLTFFDTRQHPQKRPRR